MIRLKPFAALRPLPNMAARVASPPYDVVDGDQAWAITRKNPQSFLRVTRAEVDLPPETDPHSAPVYEQARDTLARFLDEGVMMRAEPGLYIYRQVREGRRQISVMGCCHVGDYEAGVIRRHEKTRADKELDRTTHIDVTNAQTGPVFLAYRDDADIAELVRRDMNDRPLVHFVDGDGVTHTMWTSHDAGALVEAFAKVPRAYIADGHHRAASAANVARRRRHSGDAGEAEWFLSALFPVSQLQILPYHRLVKDLHGLTASGLWERMRSVGSVHEGEATVPETPGSVGLYAGGEWKRLEFASELISPDDPVASLDVSLVQNLVLEPLLGIGDPRTDPRISFLGGVYPPTELQRRVDAGDAALAVVLHPTTMEQLLAVADADLIMPPKSTWFEPKLKDGLLVHELG